MAFELTHRNDEGLRDYQIEMKSELYTAWEQGARSVMCQMPTGTGKTVVLASVIKDTLFPTENRREWWQAQEEGQERQQEAVLVVAHRREILGQIRKALKRFGLGDDLANGRIVVESIQKLGRALMPEEEPSGTVADSGTAAFKPSLVIIDEAHHCTAKTYKVLWERFPDARFLGMTATPCRLKKEGFKGLFNRLLLSWSVSKFIKEGWLSLFEYVVAKADSNMMQRVRSLTKRGVDGDYQTKELGTVMDNRASIEQLYHSYKQYAEGKTGIIYAISQVHARHIAEYFGEKGMNIACLDAKTPEKERNHIVESFRNGKIDVLTSVDVVSEGFDVPHTDFIMLARPTLSLSKYLQQVGRGLRPHKGKAKTIILDNVGHYYLFGLPNQDRDWRRMFANGQDAVNVNSSFALATVSALPTISIDINLDAGHNNDMVVVMSDGDLEDNVEKESKGIEIVKNQYGNCNIVDARNRRTIETDFTEISSFVDGFAIAKKDDDGYCYVINTRGKIEWVHPRINELLPNGIVKFDDYYPNDRSVAYCDVITKLRFDEYPDMINMDFMSFVNVGNGYIPRTEKGYDVRINKENIKLFGDMFQFKDNKSQHTAFILRNHPNRIFYLLGYSKEMVKIVAETKPSEGMQIYLFSLKKGKLCDVCHDDTIQWISQVQKLRNILDATKEYKPYYGQADGNREAIYSQSKYSAFCKKDLKSWGLCENATNKIIIKPQYQEILDYNDKYVIVKKLESANNFLIDINNNVVLKDKRYSLKKIINDNVVSAAIAKGLILGVTGYISIASGVFYHDYPVFFKMSGITFVRQTDGFCYLDMPEYEHVRFVEADFKHKDKGVAIVNGKRQDSTITFYAFAHSPTEMFQLIKKENKNTVLLKKIGTKELYMYDGVTLTGKQEKQST